MSIAQSDGYYHVQRGPWWLLCCALAAIAFTVSSSVPVIGLEAILWVAGVSLFLLSASIGHLVVEDEGNRLFIHFGPIPLFRKRIHYDDIREVEKGRLPFHENAGIHWSPWNGWTWSMGGRDCIILQLERGTFRLGTDDGEALAGFLQGRIATAGQPSKEI